MTLRAAAVLALIPGLAAAEGLELPGNAVLALETVEDAGRYALPVGPWSDGALPVETIDGRIVAQVWQIAGADLGVAGVVAGLRAELAAEGYDILLDCADRDCGGFDFRAATRVLPAPAMHVDLADFRFLAARRADSAVSVLASASDGMGFVQIIRTGAAASVTAAAPALLTRTAADPAADPGAEDAAADAGSLLPEDLGAALDRHGRVVLTDLVFDPGSAQLSAGPFASLERLAEALRDRPDLRIALVGHTDSDGGLEANVALSRRRAASVLERLATDHDVPRSRMQAEGMGWLAPIASNADEAGRNRNRRVEVIALPP